MVVVCESCSTRFKVDASRIPPKGTLVRCSRCKATFIVKASEASFEETVADVVADVAEAGGQPVPPPAEDLFERSVDDLEETRRGVPAEDAWEFDEEPVRRAAGPELALPGPERPLHEASGPALDELGPPDDWDLLGDSVDAAARTATFVEPSEAPGEVEAELPEAPQQAAAVPAPVETRRAQPPARRGRAGGVGHVLAEAGRGALRATAWLTLAGAVAVGVGAVLPGGPQPLALKAGQAVLPLPDGEARGVRVRFVENAFAGTLFVVEGELVRETTTPAQGLRVYWLDASGARVGSGAWAHPPLPVRELRERAPEAWRPAADAVAPAPHNGPFAAVFEAVPPEAHGVGVALEPLPAPPAPLAADQGGALEVEAGADAAPATTASSPPSPRPSAE